MIKPHLYKIQHNSRMIGFRPAKFTFWWLVDCLDNRFRYYNKWASIRYIKTNQERRENEFAAYYDEDCLEHKVKVRSRRHGKMLPHAWEDQPIYGKKSWKDVTKHRKQWMVNL
jgi:hypothetical protein